MAKKEKYEANESLEEEAGESVAEEAAEATKAPKRKGNALDGHKTGHASIHSKHPDGHKSGHKKIERNKVK